MPASHYALCTRPVEELARAALRLAVTQTPIEGASDHGTHEAIYLSDADGNGVELAADRPREQWPGFGYGHGPAPLDLSALLAPVAGEQPGSRVSEGLCVGHVHLHIGDIEQGLAFYRDILGFEEQANLGSAAFVSVGGYHHHLGINVWRGRGVGPAPAHTVGLRHWTVQLPSGSEVARVRERANAAGVRTDLVEDGFLIRDPWENAVADPRARQPVALQRTLEVQVARQHTASPCRMGLSRARLGRSSRRLRRYGADPPPFRIASGQMP